MEKGGLMGFFRALFDLSFREYVTVRLVRWLYLGATISAGIAGLICVAAGIWAVTEASTDMQTLEANRYGVSDYELSSTDQKRQAGYVLMASGPIGFVVVVIGGRVLAELTVVVFGIAESLRNR